MKRLLLFLLGVGMLSRAIGAEEYLFRRLDSNSGLPDNNVRNMLMLPNGLMCIQTSTMLNLFDGATCRSYAFNPIRIPYHEYAGLSQLCYDPQNRLWIVNRDNTWRFDLNTRQFAYDDQTLFEPFKLPTGAVSGFFLDDEGNYWVTRTSHKIVCCNQQNGTIREIALPEELEAPLTFTQIGRKVWMLSLNGRLACYDLDLGTFTRVIGLLPEARPLSSRMELAVTSKGDLWVMFDRDLICYHPQTAATEFVRNVPLGTNDIYTSIAVDQRDNLWVGSAKSGVSILNASSGEVHNLPALKLIGGGEVDHNTDISKIYMDRRGGVWIATLSEGVFYWHPEIFWLRTLDNESLSPSSLADQNVKCLVGEADGGLLLGTIKGLHRYNSATSSITTPYPELKNELCISLYRDKQDRIWLGTFHHGAYRIDRNGIRHYFYDKLPSLDVSYHDATPNPNCVRAFYEDRAGNFWISVYGGLGRFDPKSGRVDLLRERHPELNQFMITRSLCEVGDSLVVVSDNGRYVYLPKSDRVLFDAEDPAQHTPCNQVLTDSRGLLWIATSEGLLIRDTTGKEYQLTTQNGLPANNIQSLTTDRLGNVWAAAYDFVVRIKPLPDGDDFRFAISAFGERDGMCAGALFQNAAARCDDGMLYFGGAHGFCAVDPSQLYQQRGSSTPLLSSLMIYNRHIEVGEEYNGRCILPRELSQTRHIELRHDETFLTFEFSNLNYTNPSHTVYRYKLENFDKEWIEIHARGAGSATYTLLEPGEYVFRVMAADNDTDWSDPCAEVGITIRPPFWKSTVALLVYALLTLTLVIGGIFYLIRRMRKRAVQRHHEQLQRQKEELDQLKFRFFTNISHELRTPLSLILLPLESIIRHTDDSSPVKEQLHTIHRHATQLLSLVNHLLDFRKLEMHGERLHLTHGDIAEFIEGLVETFGDAAREKEIDLAFDNRMVNTYMAFDSAQMYKIVNNLLSNALKFTPKGGCISVRINQPNPTTLRLEVADTGIGIAPKDCAHIFERFYQSAQNTQTMQPQGSGIGLCLVKQYAEMHGGVAGVESALGKGSTFYIEIPTTLQPSDAEPAEVETAETEALPAEDSSAEEEARCRLLIVEDNADFRHYVAGELAEEFEVMQAVDGEDGLRKARKQHPDIIICDVMMPKMDGFEVCKQLKNDLDTSHIPIILLTARIDDDVRRAGYESGADAYISKPFNMELLLARIRNLIEERRRRIRNFSSTLDISPSQITVTTLDQKFIGKIMEYVELNIENPNYSVEELSSDVAMHRTNLYRKLQSITGMTPSEFLRTMRLKRAAQLLTQDSALSMTEISEMVGFNTPKYFTRYFREMFGVTPSQYAAQQKQSEGEE